MQRVLSLSLLFVAVVFILWSTSGAEGLPTESKQSSEATPTGNDKIDNSHATRKKGESNHHHATKKSSIQGEETQDVKNVHSETRTVTTQPVSTRHHGHKHKEQKSQKTLLETQNKNLSLSSNFNSTSKVAKRNSVVKGTEKDTELSNQAGTKVYDKPLEIEVKSYTPPPNVSAVIELRADKPDRTIPENSWVDYQPYPYLQNDGQYNWYLAQNPLFSQSGYPFLPTEELLHGQSFSNIPNPSISSQVLHQYPVLRSFVSNPVNSFRSDPSNFHGISSFFNNNIFPLKVTPNPKVDSENMSSTDEETLKGEPVKTQDQNTQPVAVIQQPNYSENNPVVLQPQYHFVIPQISDNSDVLPDMNGFQNSVSINSEPDLTYKPKLFKYVTKSFRLKTHPKLEWVPL
ncbi:uncharacterized protein [Periplaneta americana]|uniref:uncharacterized protein n=1 Tax=Periplaneta americana TaxID=6978 RepID=UPI0037E9B2B4